MPVHLTMLGKQLFYKGLRLMKCLFTVARDINKNAGCVTARVGSSHETKVGTPVEHVEVHTSVVLRTNDNFKHISESWKTKASSHVNMDVPSMSA